MINDKNTDHLYLADCLPKKHPTFYKNFEKLLIKNKISFSLIPGTKDIWCRDYMPIQNGLGQFINFQYKPDYLMNKRYAKTITNVKQVCKSIKIDLIDNPLNIDGGNIVHYGNKVIMCDKVLKENKNIPKKELIELLRWTLRVNHIIFIPTHPDDFCGHSDGIIRFIDNRTVIINDFKRENPEYRTDLISVLEKEKLKYIEIPYNTKSNRSSYDASGIYINFLQMKGFIFLPIYDLKEDEIAIKLLTNLFKKEKVIPVKCNSIAKEGGVLNCISWTIKSNYPKELSEYEKEIDRDLLNLGLEFNPDFDSPPPYSDESLKELSKL